MLPLNNQQHPKQQTLLIGGIVPFTTIDYPEHLAAVIFCKGCCWHCPYCHNQELIDINTPIKDAPTWDNVLNFLQQRKGLLDGIVFSGGEPLLQPFIITAMKQAKDMGFSIALHTNGHNPAILAEVIPFVDWVGIDIKTSFANYYKAISKNESMWEKNKKLNFGNQVEQSLNILLKSNITFECRTTLDPRVVSKEDLKQIAKNLHSKGTKTFAIQEYRKTDESASQPTDEEITSFFSDSTLMNELKTYFPNLIVRRA